MFYRFEEEKKATITLLKRGVSFKQTGSYKLQVLPLNHGVAGPKKKDVESLLVQLFGESWRECENFDSRHWYSSIIDGTPTLTEETSDASTTQECDCLEDDQGIHI